MQTSKWGPPLHEGLFHIAAGFDLNETPDNVKRKQYKDFFRSVGDVLPCKFCRESYRVFFDSLNIDKYMDETCGLVRFYYDMRELINEKLVHQEEKKLCQTYLEIAERVSPQTPEFWMLIREKSHEICYTKPAPPYEKVVDDLMKNRASCDTSLKTCRAPRQPF